MESHTGTRAEEGGTWLITSSVAAEEVDQLTTHLDKSGRGRETADHFITELTHWDKSKRGRETADHFIMELTH